MFTGSWQINTICIGKDAADVLLTFLQHVARRRRYELRYVLACICMAKVGICK